MNIILKLYFHWESTILHQNLTQNLPLLKIFTPSLLWATQCLKFEKLIKKGLLYCSGSIQTSMCLRDFQPLFFFQLLYRHLHPRETCYFHTCSWEGKKQENNCCPKYCKFSVGLFKFISWNFLQLTVNKVLRLYNISRSIGVPLLLHLTT